MLLTDRARDRERKLGERKKIKVTTIFVDDQDKALRFHTDVLGFIKKNDFGQGGPYRWLP